jgi:type I restriction enzyme S subunit
MRSSYRKLGSYIRQVDERNKQGIEENLLGVSTQKVFIESIANTVGTNFKKYKIVKRKQFTYVPDTSRRGDKIGLAMLDHLDEAIVSQAYTVFEIINHEELDPEYLMMWFRRPEFDRYARYKSHGSVREIFGWDEMCDVELPIPSIEKQREIVAEYNTIVNRIQLNEQMNQKLEETVQAIYKHWFVDFEFPISAEYAVSISKPELEGKPYKSSGGEMVFCSELDQEIPKGWATQNLSNFVKPNPDNISKNDSFNDIFYLDTGSITNNKIDGWQRLNLLEDEIPSRAKRKVIHNDIIYSTVRPNLKHFGILRNPPENAVVSTGFCVLRSKNKLIPAELIYSWISSDEITTYLHAKAEMSVSTYPSIKPEDLLAVKIAFPTEDILKIIKKVFVPLFQRSEISNSESQALIKASLIIQQKIAKAVA